jgi:integrase
MQRGFVKKRGPTWTAYYYVIEGLERRQRSKGGFKTKAAALSFLNETLTALQRGELVERSELTLGEYLTERWLPIMEHQVRPTTFLSYQRMMVLHVLPALGTVPLQKLTVDHLDQLYARLMSHGRLDGTGGLSAKTVRYIHNTIHKALKDAERKRLISHNVAQAADPPKVRPMGEVEQQTWTAEQVRFFLEGSRQHPLHVAFVLAATTGMRRGEVLGLRWRDVDLTAPQLVVRQTLLAINYKLSFGSPKTARGRRALMLDAATAAVLHRHREDQWVRRATIGASYRDHDLVIARVDGEPYHPDYVTQAFERVLLRLGLPRIRFHDLRHTHATLGLAAGVPAKIMSDRLGHATVAFTQDIYMHAIPAMKTEAADRIAGLIFGPAEQPGVA